MRASRAVRDIVERAGGTALGHYYFRDFYCADSGPLPTLLMLELLSVERRRLSELLEPFRSKYFISGEITSKVQDQDGKMNEHLVQDRPRTAYQIAHGAVGKHRRHSGLPDALGGARSPRPARGRRTRARAHARGCERLGAALSRDGGNRLPIPV